MFLDTDDQRYFSDETRRVIRDFAVATELEFRSLLPGLPDEIELAIQTGEMVIPETGAVGSALSLKRVLWTVDPSRPEGIEATVGSQLRYSLLHEFHHIVRGWVLSHWSPQNPFIDGVVAEGLATAFERDFGGCRPLWGEYPAEVDAWIRELLELPSTAPYWHWMFQHPDGRRWIGYRAGTYIADRAIAASSRSAAELVQTPTGEILSLAGIET
jgi:uncharacterized protein YjaZ